MIYSELCREWTMSKKNMSSFQVVELSFSFPSSSHAEHSGCGGELKDCTQTAKHSWICKSKLISIWFNVIYFTCPSGTEPHNKSTSVSLKQLLPLFGSPLFGNTELVNISRSSARCVRYYQWKFLLLQHISILANFHIFSLQNVNIIIYLMAHLAI